MMIMAGHQSDRLPGVLACWLKTEKQIWSFSYPDCDISFYYND